MTPGRRMQDYPESSACSGTTRRIRGGRFWCDSSSSWLSPLPSRLRCAHGDSRKRLTSRAVISAGWRPVRCRRRTSSSRAYATTDEGLRPFADICPKNSPIAAPRSASLAMGLETRAVSLNRYSPQRRDTARDRDKRPTRRIASAARGTIGDMWEIRNILGHSHLLATGRERLPGILYNL